MANTIFSSWDWLIMGGTFAASALIGLYFRFTGGRQKTNEEYLLGDRNLSVFPVAVSLMASFMSAITLIGVSFENYAYGSQFVVINLAYALSTPIVTQLYLPVFYELKTTSTYEYLEMRFGSKIRIAASLTYTLQMVLYNGIVLYAPAIVLESVTGLDRLFSILLVGLVCTFYSTLGGMKAVVWTDLLQSFLMFAAMVSVVIFATNQVGGINNVLSAAKAGGRLELDNFSLDPTERHTWWSLIIGGSIVYLSLYAVNHTQVQRLQTVSSLNKSRLCLWISWPVLSVLSVTTCFSGLAIFAVFKGCDPLQAGYITASDQLLPYYVISAMRAVPGLAGLFIAGIFSASLSTISAACNALAAVTLTDYVARWYPLKPSIYTVLTKLASCAYGLIFLGVAFLAEYLGGVLQASLTIFGAVGGPLLGVFTLGMFTTYANEAGAVTSLLSGIALTLWMSFGGPRPPATYLPVSVADCPGNVTLSATQPHEATYFYLYRISYMWTSPIGLVWVLVIGSAVSVCTRGRQPWQREDGSGTPDPKLFTPPLARWIVARTKDKSVEMSPVDNSMHL